MCCRTQNLPSLSPSSGLGALSGVSELWLPAVPDVICFGSRFVYSCAECCGCGTYRSIRACGLIAFGPCLLSYHLLVSYCSCAMCLCVSVAFSCPIISCIRQVNGEPVFANKQLTVRFSFLFQIRFWRISCERSKAEGFEVGLGFRSNTGECFWVFFFLF